MIELLFIITMMVVGFVSGTIIERQHYKSIHQRENNLLKLPAVPSGLSATLSPQQLGNVHSSAMVMGSVVISEDYFKSFLAILKGMFGGNLPSFESLVDRARREAVLRMKEKMPFADLIVNTRIETATIGGDAMERRSPITSIEVVAYGTAIFFKKD